MSPVVTVTGSLAAGTSLTIDIEGAPPPTADGTPPFTLAVRFNAWSIQTLTPTWNPETQAWSVTWHIPAGQRNALCTVALMIGGNLVEQSFTVQ